MTFRDARDLALEFGARLPAFDHSHPLAQCWIDRITLLPVARDLASAIAEANRYSGR
jgi:hypothetical protein